MYKQSFGASEAIRESTVHKHQTDKKLFLGTILTLAVIFALTILFSC